MFSFSFYGFIYQKVSPQKKEVSEKMHIYICVDGLV